MRTKISALLAASVLALLPAPGTGGGCEPETPTHDHSKEAAHRATVCGLKRVGEIEVSKDAGLGQVEIRGNIAAVLGRDEGTVSLVDVKNPRKPRVLGRYADDIADSFDGDLAFSADGKWLFYARQTHQFSKDGVHVLNISDPKQPSLAFYQPQGGSFRIDYLKHDGGEYVVTMDAMAGLVVNRFEAATGALVPVFADPLPALKVGGPASAGVYIDPKDPKLGVPLLYATNGQTGLDVYDMSQPMSPTKIGSWTGAGLADIEVRATKKGRTVMTASEYWFQDTPPVLYELDATKLDSIKERASWTLSKEMLEPWRINGIELAGNRTYVALGHSGLVALDSRGRYKAVYQVPRPMNPNATLLASPYAMDVDSAKGMLYATDAATGRLTILKD